MTGAALAGMTARGFPLRSAVGGEAARSPPWASVSCWVDLFLGPFPSAAPDWFYGKIMKNESIELTGKMLLDVVNEGEIDLGHLHETGVVGVPAASARDAAAPVRPYDHPCIRRRARRNSPA